MNFFLNRLILMIGEVAIRKGLRLQPTQQDCWSMVSYQLETLLLKYIFTFSNNLYLPSLTIYHICIALSQIFFVLLFCSSFTMQNAVSSESYPTLQTSVTHCNSTPVSLNTLQYSALYCSAVHCSTVQ